jgi:hypothetical protein
MRSRPRFTPYVRLVVTPLEDRTVPAVGLSESFVGGVLRVTDWRATDAIVVHQTVAGITVDAGNDSQTFTAVSRVLLDVQNNVRVTNEVSGLNGVAAREIYVSRRDATGTTFVSTGNLPAGATSGLAATVPPTPSKTDWFSAAVGDQTLRSVAHSLAADGTLSRSDWLQLFAQVEKDGTVTAGEIRDLDDLLHPGQVKSTNAAGYSVPASVRNLAGKVVDGNVANVHYHGTALGNLHAGSTAGQLQKLVAKWFLGTDHPAAAAGTTYRLVSGSLFVNGPNYGDVIQGQLGDCYFVAAMAGVARFSPQLIQQMAIDNGDGTFTVRFFHAGVADYVTVDRDLPSTSYGTAEYAGFGGQYTSGGNELWVAVIEKAYAQINEEGWLGHAPVNSYAAIDGGYSDLAISQLTGAAAGWTWMTNANPNSLIAAVATGRPLVLASQPVGSGNGVIDSHGYSLVGYNAATGRFTLYNPWGSTITLTLAQIRQSFLGFWQAQ